MKTPAALGGHPQPQVLDRTPVGVAHQPGDPDERDPNRRVQEPGPQRVGALGSQLLGHLRPRPGYAVPGGDPQSLGGRYGGELPRPR